ncbi:MAG: polymer-forming cytoskeletal protein [Chloroflexi bacterium]|nr:polymer-forming cytoskeletal protein [Chloroflexota bacterium]
MSFFTGGRRQPQEPPVQTSQPAPSSTASTLSSTATPRQPVGFETVLGANSTLRGELRSQANVRLDGTFEGTLEIEGNVLVGETGKVTADINARNVVIAGAVRGNVSGNKVQLLKTSRVWGDIHATAITTEEGAFIDGKITMVRHDASIQSFEPASLPEPGTPPEVKDEKLESKEIDKGADKVAEDKSKEPTLVKAEISETAKNDEDIEVVVGETVKED